MTITERQRELYQDMRAEGKHLLDRPEGWYRSSADTDVSRTFRLYDWTPPSKSVAGDPGF